MVAGESAISITRSSAAHPRHQTSRIRAFRRSQSQSQALEVAKPQQLAVAHCSCVAIVDVIICSVSQFCAGFCAVSKTLPLTTNGETEIITTKLGSNGLNAACMEVVHCLAAEPHATFVRVAVLDGGQEVAYEIAVIGRLQSGFRVLQLRSILGTRIELACLFVKLSIGSEPNTFATARQVRWFCACLSSAVVPQRAIFSFPADRFLHVPLSAPVCSFAA